MSGAERQTPFLGTFFGEEIMRAWGEEIRALEEEMIMNWEKGGLGPIEYLEQWREKAVTDLYEASQLGYLDLDKFLRGKETRGLSREIEVKHAVRGTEFKGVPENELYLRKRQQYLTLIFGAAIKIPSFYIDTTISYLKTDTSPIQEDYVMFGAVEFVKKCQAAVRTTSLEQAGKIIGNPKPEVFAGLRELVLRVEVKTEDGETYKGDVSPLQMMDLMDSPEWSQRIMTSNREAVGEYRGYYYWRQKELVNELLCQRLKNEQGQKLPKEAQIKSTNLYDFSARQRIDSALGEEMSVSPRELAVNNLSWLYDVAWYVFSIGGRQRAWDKALEGDWGGEWGGWPMSEMQKALLPASYEDVRRYDDLWLTRRFFSVSQLRDLWSEQASCILPFFWAKKERRRINDDSKEVEIIKRKAMRFGTLPHLEEEESKIALGLGEYADKDWYQKAKTWFEDEEHITFKGEMRPFEEIRKVPWTEEEKRAIAEVDFLPALEMMQQKDPEVVIDREKARGYDGFRQIAEQLSYQNLHYSGMLYHAWARQMDYLEAASRSYDILKDFFKTLTNASIRTSQSIKELNDPIEFWEDLEKAGLEVAELMKNFSMTMSDVEGVGSGVEAGTELLWAVAQAYTYYQREWLPRTVKRDDGSLVEIYINADRITQDRRDVLRRLGYQFIKIGSGEERVFGPSGSPVRMLDKYEGFYCAVEERFKGRALGWNFLAYFLGKVSAVYFGSGRYTGELLNEIKEKVPDEWPSYLPSERGWLRRKFKGFGMLGKRREGKRIKV